LEYQVKQDLENDISREIIEPVPVGSPVEWYSKMIVNAKKNGSPCRVVKYQKLNKRRQISILQKVMDFAGLQQTEDARLLQFITFQSLRT